VPDKPTRAQIHEHQARHDPQARREPGCPLCASWVHPAARSATDRAAQLEAENEKLRDRVSVLEARCGHLMVDADRREERARKIAESCAEHGTEITYLRHMASWCWSDAQKEGAARRAIVGALQVLIRDRLGDGRGDGTVPVPALAAWLHKAIDAQNRPMRKHGFPTLADCQRAGGCEHDALSPELAAVALAAHREAVHSEEDLW
jgi:hypothetical protein